jgi:hypothetical protein
MHGRWQYCVTTEPEENMQKARAFCSGRALPLSVYRVRITETTLPITVAWSPRIGSYWVFCGSNHV